MAEAPAEDEENDEALAHEQLSVEEKRCPKCSEINRRKALIECTQCGSHYHRSCVGIRKNQASTLRRYRCLSCLNGTLPNREPPIVDNQTTPDFDLLQHLMTCKSRLSLIGNIPRGARITAVDILSDLINDVIHSNTSLTWFKPLCFMYHGLQKIQKRKIYLK